MLKMNEKKDIITSSIQKEYDPTNDLDIEDDLSDALDNIRRKFDPYQRYIMIVGFTILVLLVVYMGYARGALDVCNDLDGRLEIDWGVNIECHPRQSIPAIDAQNPRVNVLQPIDFVENAP